MVIELKPNNEPQKPGIFLVKRTPSFRPEVAEVKKQQSRSGSSELVMVSNFGIFPIKRCGPALWSDEIVCL